MAEAVSGLVRLLAGLKATPYRGSSLLAFLNALVVYERCVVCSGRLLWLFVILQAQACSEAHMLVGSQPPTLLFCDSEAQQLSPGCSLTSRISGCRDSKIGKGRVNRVRSPSTACCALLRRFFGLGSSASSSCEISRC